MEQSPNGMLQRPTHRGMLMLCCVVLAATPLLKVLPNQCVAVRWSDSLVLPPSCPSREIFNVNCPGCGLTRSFIHLAHGDWESSLRVNRVGWLIMLMAAVQIPYRAHAIWGSGRWVLAPRAANRFALTLVAILFGSWVVGLLMGNR